MSLIVDGTTGVTFNDSSLQGAAASPYVLKNRIINGDMRIDQRNDGASVTSTPGGNIFCVDRWFGFSTNPAIFTMQQVSDAPAGFINSVKITTTTEDSSLSASDFNSFRYIIEGLNISDLGWGTADAKTITLSFWAKSSLTGTFTVALRNSAVNRSYIATYTISSANTWEYKSITITGDTSGTWLTTNGIGIRLDWSLGSGSDFQGTAGSWTATNDTTTSGATSLVGTNGATLYITGVQLEIGTSATPFERRLYGQELINCQRYYEQIIVGNMQIPSGSGSGMINPISFHVQKRATPTMATITAATTNGSATVQLNGVSVNNWGLQFINNSAANNFFTNSPVYSASAEL